MSAVTVGAMFDKPDGPVRLLRGRWWIDRDALGLDEVGEITVRVADGHRVAVIDGTPAQLRALAEAIVAQVDSAEQNEANKEPSEAELIRYYGHEGGEDPVVRQQLRDAGRPGL